MYDIYFSLAVSLAVVSLFTERLARFGRIALGIMFAYDLAYAYLTVHDDQFRLIFDAFIVGALYGESVAGQQTKAKDSLSLAIILLLSGLVVAVLGFYIFIKSGIPGYFVGGIAITGIAAFRLAKKHSPAKAK